MANGIFSKFERDELNKITAKSILEKLMNIRQSINVEFIARRLIWELMQNAKDYLNTNIPKTRFIYEYNDSNRVVNEYKIDDEGNKQLESWCKHEYYPNGKLKAIIRNSILQEEYDEQGRVINKEPGFEILYKDFQEYDYDDNGNWTKTKNFKGYVDFGTGVGRILKPYVERSFTYYEE